MPVIVFTELPLRNPHHEKPQNYQIVGAQWMFRPRGAATEARCQSGRYRPHAPRLRDR